MTAKAGVCFTHTPAFAVFDVSPIITAGIAEQPISPYGIADASKP